jgi:two-component system, OmpR family, sensor histidine kinase QseC
MKIAIALLARPSLFRRQLVVTLVTMLFLCIAVIAAWFSDLLSSEVDQDLKVTAATIATFIDGKSPDSAQAEAEKVAKLYAQLSLPLKTTGNFHYLLSNQDGSISHSSGAPIDIMQVFAKSKMEGTQKLNDWYVSTASVSNSPTLVTVAISRSFIFSARVQGIKNFLPVLLIIFGLTACLVWFATRFAVKPLKTLATEVGIASATDFSLLATEARHTETEPLLNAINEKTTSLKNSLQRERQFFSDAAHELRTPLAVISAQAYRAEKDQSDVSKKDAFRSLHLGIRRSSLVLSSLLNLARLDGQKNVLDAQGINVVEVSKQVISDHASRAIELGQEIALEASPETATSILVLGDEHDVRLIFDNLIDNAIRYSGAGSTITVTINCRDGKRIDIQALDNGPNFTAEDAELAFVRFKRGSQSNTSTLTPTGESAVASGSGLGLAIVKAAAGKLGGDAMMKARGETNTYSVLVSLPLFKR